MNLLRQTKAQHAARIELARVLMHSPTARRLVCPQEPTKAPQGPFHVPSYGPSAEGFGPFGKTLHGD